MSTPYNLCFQQDSDTMTGIHARWILFALFTVIFLAGCGRDYEAARVLAEIAGREVPAALGARTPEPARNTIVYRVNGRGYVGDLYRPPVPVEAGVVLVPGAAEKGKDDPRLMAFATTLARARFAVLVPDLQGLRKLKVGPGNIREIADAFAWLVSRNDLAPGGRA
ncbi:MAG: hypothetical protein EG828_11980, partial [Deltaproteobacteria bacterium]|nr:hypothetical protein [Deltaproteobacteria bacterium]